MFGFFHKKTRYYSEYHIPTVATELAKWDWPRRDLAVVARTRKTNKQKTMSTWIPSSRREQRQVLHLFVVVAADPFLHGCDCSLFLWLVVVCGVLDRFVIVFNHCYG